MRGSPNAAAAAAAGIVVVDVAAAVDVGPISSGVPLLTSRCRVVAAVGVVALSVSSRVVLLALRDCCAAAAATAVVVAAAAVAIGVVLLLGEEASPHTRQV